MPGAILPSTQAELRSLRSIATGLMFQASQGNLSLAETAQAIREAGASASLGAISAMRSRVNAWRSATNAFAAAAPDAAITGDMTTWDLSANITQAATMEPQYYALVQMVEHTPSGDIATWRTLTDFNPVGMTKDQLLSAGQDLINQTTSEQGTNPNASMSLTGSMTIVQF